MWRNRFCSKKTPGCEPQAHRKSVRDSHPFFREKIRKKVFFLTWKSTSVFFFVKIAFALLSFKRKAVQFCCLPPHGGSGLKSVIAITLVEDRLSPSTRREWIEITYRLVYIIYRLVSLHTEGVD